MRQAKDATPSAVGPPVERKRGGRGALSVGARPTNERPNRRGVLTLTSRMALLLRWLPIGAGLIGLWLAASTTAHALTPEERAIAWETFQATERNEWQRASRLAALIDDPLPAKTVRWLRMVEDGQPADFATIARFLIDNPHWPWPEQLQTIAEETITDPADHALIRRLFADRPPLTTRGHIRYAEALFDIDQDEPAEALIRKAWIEGDFSPREEQRFLQKYRQLLAAPITSRAWTICCGTIAATRRNGCSRWSRTATVGWPRPGCACNGEAASKRRSRRCRRAAQRSWPHVRPHALASAEAARPGRARGAARPAGGAG